MNQKRFVQILIIGVIVILLGAGGYVAWKKSEIGTLENDMVVKILEVTATPTSFISSETDKYLLLLIFSLTEIFISVG